MVRLHFMRLLFICLLLRVLQCTISTNASDHRYYYVLTLNTQYYFISVRPGIDSRRIINKNGNRRVLAVWTWFGLDAS
ncbi:hypothetical protein BDQ17DRAFT_1376430 [Cyathus striatus]|nr:hypothetical protein BDQ17DRAFT_1376430 [Cyathus striatus]